MLLTLLLTLSAPVPAAPPGWPVFRGNAAMTGVAAVALPDTLEIRWKFKTGNAIESAAAIVDGVVYVASGDQHLYAIDLKTGQQKWKTPLDAPIKASPAVNKDRVYVGNSDGKFFALDTATGKILWTFDTSGEITGGANFHGDNILVGCHNNALFCISPAGAKLWEFRIEGPVNGSVAVAGDRTFVAGCDSLLHVLDAKTGKNLGEVDLGGQTGATAAVLGDSVYVGTMSNQVVAINWKTLKKTWLFENPRKQQPFYSSASVTEGLVVVGCRDKKLYAIDRATGKEKWSFIAEGMIDGSPLVAGSRVYVGSLHSDGHFHVLDLATGKKVMPKLELDSAVTGSPAAGPDCVLIGTEKGTLYCLGRKP